MFKTDLPTKLENTKGFKAMQVISIKDAFNGARFDLSSALLSEVPFTEDPQKCSSIPQSRPKIPCNPVVPNVIFGIPHTASRTFSQSLISPRFCFKVPKLELRIREIPDPKNLLGTLYTGEVVRAVTTEHRRTTSRRKHVWVTPGGRSSLVTMSVAH